MTTADLARRCAQEVGGLVNRPDTRGVGPLEDQIARLIEGAITRALDEAGRPPVARLDTASLGAVDVKVTKSTQGVSLEVDCKRPRQPGESWDEAISASALCLAVAYTRASEQLGKIGLTPGRETKP